MARRTLKMPVFIALQPDSNNRGTSIFRPFRTYAGSTGAFSNAPFKACSDFSFEALIICSVRTIELSEIPANVGARSMDSDPNGTYLSSKPMN